MGFMKKLKKLFKTPGGNDGAQGDDPDSDTDLPAAVGPDGDPTSGPTTPRLAASPIKPKSQDGKLPQLLASRSARRSRHSDSFTRQPEFMLPSGSPTVKGAAHVTLTHESSSSITSMLSMKMKNMVFVEAPATIELESDGHSLPRLASRNGQGYTPHSSQAGSLVAGDTAWQPGNDVGMSPTPHDAAAATRHIQPLSPLPQQQQNFRRVLRHASLPLLIDTSMPAFQGPPECLTPQPPTPAPATGSSAARVAAAAQHVQENQDSLPTAYRASLMAQQAGGQVQPAARLYQPARPGLVSPAPGGSPAPDLEGRGTGSHEQAGVQRYSPGAWPVQTAADGQSQPVPAAGSQQVLQTRRRPPRHASLKHLLKLDKYQFMSDVNVLEAQRMMEAGTRSDADMQGSQASSRTSQGLPSDSTDSSHPSWRQGALHSPACASFGPDEWEASNILAVNPAVPPGMRRPAWSVGDFKLIKKLHQGYASDVYFARCRRTLELVVLKVYRLADQCDLQRVQLYREIRVHSRLQHQNIVQFYAAFLEANCVIIVQEYAAEGDLLRYMYKTGGRLTERQAVGLVLQPFLSALLYLHTQGIIHRDIKPENCLLTETKQLKLADFGLAVDLNEERANTRAGTLDYMAPEVLRCPTKNTPDQFKSTPGAAHYEMGADAWAVGVFAFELVAGGSPFKAEQMVDTARNIISVNISYPAAMSERARSFISGCLKKHPGDRPTVLHMLHHPWIAMFTRRASVVTPNPALAHLSRSDVSAGSTESGVPSGPHPEQPSPAAR